MIAEVTWVGVSKSQHVGGQVFNQNKLEIVTDEKLIEYLKNQRGFTVTVRAAKSKPRPKPSMASAAKPAAKPEAKPAAEMPKPASERAASRRGPRRSEPSDS